jgi:hypothetical protein
MRHAVSVRSEPVSYSPERVPCYPRPPSQAATGRGQRALAPFGLWHRPQTNTNSCAFRLLSVKEHTSPDSSGIIPHPAAVSTAPTRFRPVPSWPGAEPRRCPFPGGPGSRDKRASGRDHLRPATRNRYGTPSTARCQAPPPFFLPLFSRRARTYPPAAGPNLLLADRLALGSPGRPRPGPPGRPFAGRARKPAHA